MGMIYIEHRDAPEGERHAPHNWTFANQAAREAAGAYTTADIGKWALQSSDASLWRLVSQVAGVPTWAGIGGGDVTQTELDAETAARIAADSAQATALVNETDARSAGDTAEANTRAEADTNLQNNIDAANAARQTEDTNLAVAINGEIGNRMAADASIQSDLATEQGTRFDADNVLQDNITAEAAARAAADTAHAGAVDPHAQYMTQAESDARYPLTSGLVETIQDTMDSTIQDTGTIVKSYNDAAGTMFLSLATTLGGGDDQRAGLISWADTGLIHNLVQGWPYQSRSATSPSFALNTYGYGIDASAADVAIALPSISDVGTPAVWFVRREDASANLVTFVPSGSDIINPPYDTISLDGQGNAVMAWADTGRNEWNILPLVLSTGGSGGGGPVALDDLTDVVLTSPNDGDFLYHNGTSWVNLTWLQYTDGALLIGSSVADAMFRLLPYGNDIYFQNTHDGNIYFTGAGGSALNGLAVFTVHQMGLNSQDMAGGQGGFSIGDAATAPTTSPSSGSVLYSQGGKLKVVGASKAAGEIATLADIPTVPTTEAIQDIVGAMVVAGTNATVTYDDPAGTLTIGASSPTGFSALMDAVIDYLATNTDPRDTKLTSGSYVALVFFSSRNTNGWTGATNATHTVTAGKKLVIVYSGWSSKNLEDTSGGRNVRLQNTTDTATVVAALTQYQHASPYYWDGDLAVTSKFPEVAAGKTVRIEIFNGDTNKRASGAFIIGKEV